MNTPLPYRHLSDLSERQLLQVIVDKFCCVAGKYILDVYGGAAAAYSLRSLSKDTTDVVRVRRSADNAEADFTAREITNGTMTAWVNADMPLPLDTASAAAAYSLRNLKTSYTGSVIRVRRSVDNAEADFNPTEITDGTLLSWVGGVNLLLFSEQFDNPYYLKLLGTLTTNQTTAPDGSLTADLFTKTSGVNTVSGVRANGVYSSTGIHTYSIYVKQNVGDSVLLRLDAAANTANASFNFSTKTISTSGANVINATATELSDGWFRLSVTANVTNTSWGLSIANLFSNPTNDSVYVWGAQLNEGATAGDYAPTTSNVSGYGYVTTWYDQSGNSNDATQATAAKQPKIVDAGVLVEENGKPAVSFDGVNDYFSITPLTQTSEFSHFVTSKGTGFLYGTAIGGADYLRYTGFIRIAINGTNLTENTNVDNLQTQTSFIRSNTDLTTIYYNSNTGASLTISGDFNSNTTGGYNNGTLFWNGNIQEHIIYSSDQSSNRVGIETNINDYYNIYAQDRDGFVTTWYDQSGNGNNATQATASQQPQIVDAGSLITSNGYTVIQYDGTNDNLTTSLTATGTMLMGGSDGTAFYEVDINGSYSLLANASNTDHPLNESIRVIWSSSLTTAQKTAIEALITYTDWDFSDVTNFEKYWRNRSELTSFPLLDVSNGNNFGVAWFSCSSLTSFPELNVSSGTNFREAWRLCSSLTSFPLLDVSSGTNFLLAWNGCSSLEDFPANRFDSVTATNFTNTFGNTNLSSQSIENIVVSIDTAGQSNGTLNITGGGNATTATAQTAIDSLTAKGWTVTVPDGYVSPYLIDVYPNSAAAYSLRQLSYNTTDVVRVRRSSDNAEADFTATEITDGTLLSWVGNTASDNGFVTTWYDQAGSNDATQATAAEQPKIVDAGVLVEENGKPALDFNGSTSRLSATVLISNTEESSNFVVVRGDVVTPVRRILNHVTGLDARNMNFVSSQFNIFDGVNSLSAGTAIAQMQYLIEGYYKTNDAEIYVNNSSIGTSSTFNQNSVSALDIGYSLSVLFDGVIQEVVLYNTNQRTTNRSGIEANINNHYNIYP